MCVWLFHFYYLLQLINFYWQCRQLWYYFPPELVRAFLILIISSVNRFIPNDKWHAWYVAAWTFPIRYHWSSMVIFLLVTRPPEVEKWKSCTNQCDHYFAKNTYPFTMPHAYPTCLLQTFCRIDSSRRNLLTWSHAQVTWDGQLLRTFQFHCFPVQGSLTFVIYFDVATSGTVSGWDALFL